MEQVTQRDGETSGKVGINRSEESNDTEERVRGVGISERKYPNEEEKEQEKLV